MTTHNNQRQPEASAPENPSTHCSLSDEEIDRRIAPLILHHEPIACLVCTNESPIFWVLDLEEPQARRAVEFLLPDHPVDKIARAISARGLVPAFMMTTGFALLKSLWTNVLKCSDSQCPPPPPPGSYYLAICSANSLTVREGRSFPSEINN